MNETMNPQATKPTSKLLDGVNVNDTDRDMQFNSLLLNLEWEIHGVATMLWALDQIFVESPPETVATSVIFDRIAHLIQMSADRATQLYEDLSKAHSFINKAAVKVSGHKFPASRSAAPVDGLGGDG